MHFKHHISNLSIGQLFKILDFDNHDKLQFHNEGTNSMCEVHSGSKIKIVG